MNQARATTLAAGMEITPNVRLLRPLGVGGMGAVWLAEHSGLNTHVVVKFMLGELDTSASARARFKREAEAASQVKSPHVVQTFDCGVTSEGLPFIVMEHLEGLDLAKEIAARGALEPARVVRIVSQVSKALAKAHAANLLHRDIKPDNIFLCHHDADDDLFVKLLDFGIAKTHADEGTSGSLGPETKTGQVVGTPYYMSPEQVTAQKVIDLRSDLWALGVVAFEALTGRRPFDGPSFGALAVQIATGDPPAPSAINPSLPPAVDGWFAKACARHPEARFASARELADAFRTALEGTASLPPIGSRSSEPASRAVDDPTARPSFVLASTSLDATSSIEPSPARQSDGTAAVASDERGGRMSRRSIGLLSALVLVAMGVGVGIGRTDRAPLPGRDAAASPGTVAGPRAADSKVPSRSEPQHLDASQAMPDAPVLPVADVGPRVAAQPTASHPVPGRAPIVRPSDTTVAPAPSSTGLPGRHNDPLF